MNRMPLLLLILFGSACLAARPTVVARDGQALMPIIVSPDASKQLREVAEDLAMTLGGMTGGTFVVSEGTADTAGILLGTREQFPGLGYDEALAIRHGYDGIEACVVSTQGTRVILLGATEKGAAHAAYRLLHAAGCRWFFPNEAWTVIPHEPNLTLDLEEASRPAFWSRRIWYGYGFFDRNKGRVEREYRQWARRNLQGESLTVYCGHAWQAIIAAHKAEFEAHPEYLALVGGERKGPQLCVSNPGLRQLVADYAVGYFTQHPEADMVSLDPADGSGHCECEACVAMGSVSERVFGLANFAARALATKHPRKLVGLYAYNDHSEPPSFKLEPTVYIQLTRGFIRGQYTFDELRDIWPTHCQSMGFYDYYSVYLWDWDMIPGGRGANVAYLAESIRSYAASKATTLSCESGDNWGVHGRGYYLASQLMWNPQANETAILADFYDQAFGPAAKAMQRFYERLDPGNKPLMSAHLIALALRDLEEGSTLAAKRPDVLARLDQLKQYMHYVCLRWEFDRSGEKGRKKELALAILTHVHRNRYTYMNHWEAIRQTQTRKWAKEFDEPTWAFNEKTPDKPWAVEEPNTTAETATQFASDLQSFTPEVVTEVSFSDELVPASLPGPAKALSLGFQGSGAFILYSREDEPLAWTLTVGTIAWYRDRADARYRLIREADGSKVVEGRLKLTGEPVAFSAKIPAAGRYRLEIDESGAGFRLVIPAEQPAVLPLERGREYHHFGHMPRMFFYVPKGTRELRYFIANSSAHTLLGPDGKSQFVGEGSGLFYHVPIPKGMDGQLWSISHLALGELWFFNAPNVLASSPGTMLLPSELVR